MHLHVKHPEAFIGIGCYMKRLIIILFLTIMAALLDSQNALEVFDSWQQTPQH